MIIVCEKCGKKIKFPDDGIDETQEYVCPYCDAIINVQPILPAKKLEDKKIQKEYEEYKRNEKRALEKQVKTENIKVERFGVYALIVPVCAILLAWVWIPQLSLFDHVSDKLYFLWVVTILLSSFFVSLEVSLIKENNSNVELEDPIYWFLLCVIGWVFSFPYWMYRRAEYGLKEYWGYAILIMLIFSITFGVLAMAIENRKTEIRNGLEIMQKGFENTQRSIDRAFGEFERGRKGR